MTEIERKILDCLLELDHAAKSISAESAKPDLLPLFERIDKLSGQLPPGSDRDLLHYLHKKSYEKARLHLLAAQG